MLRVKRRVLLYEPRHHVVPNQASEEIDQLFKYRFEPRGDVRSTMRFESVRHAVKCALGDTADSNFS